ncbi:MAG: DUF1553 domain-containing protein [Gemmataceae bacterium]|nr:DUF1553 domain-containing protein [Gemmataceae bacterium]
MQSRAGVRCLTAAIAVLLLSAGLRAGEPNAKPPLKAEPPQAALKTLLVHPPQVTLDGPRDLQHLVVIGEYADGRRWDLTRTAKYVSSAATVVQVDATGIVRPVSDGQAEIKIEVGGQSTTVPVKVQRAKAETAVSFAREVVPVLTKAGCNMGACHGAQHGRGGFKLSLLGFDPLYDYGQIVQSAEGRRVVLSDPERSILLQKPILTMEHGGGERLVANSRGYHFIKTWLEDGAPEPTAKDPSVTALDVWPPKRVVVPGDQQQIIVRATWSDGRKEDVTTFAQYDSLNESVAQVTPGGLVTALDRGETHIMIRYCGQATVMQVSLPFARVEPFPETPRNNFVDDKLIAKWKDLGLTPSGLCSDEDFLRRIYLDTIGTMPSPAEIKAFLADQAPDKRKKAIDAVLNRPEFVDFWTLKWGDLLRIDRDQLQEKGMWSFFNWLRASLRDGKPMDEFARDIITAEGSTYSEGPANYYRVGRGADEWAETTAQVFLGVRMQCAKCHHHPFEKWSQDDYYGMSAFFVRLGTKNSQEFGIFGRETIVFLRPDGESRNPRSGAVIKPRPLDGPISEDPFDRRRKLAEWMTAKENAFFARNLVNRFWGYYMGRGLVEPMDDMRATNPPSNPELLDALAKDFVEHKYDLKHLLRTIMNSRGYQLTSFMADGNRADVTNVHYTRYSLKRLSAEQLADALDAATGTQEKYTGLPLGTRAIQLPDTKVRSFLLDVFGRPARQITCECERTMQPNIAQALHLLNGDFMNKKIADPKGRIETLLQKKTPAPAIIEELYLVTLARMPKPEEIKRAEGWIGMAPSPKEGVQDLLWVLLNSREFLFNH